MGVRGETGDLVLMMRVCGRPSQLAGLPFLVIISLRLGMGLE